MQLYNITYEPEANEDIRQISSWYEACKEGLGKEFRNEVRERIEEILTKNPKIRQIVYKNQRHLSLKRFPHKIVFLVDETNQNVQIIAIIHPKQN